jgi:spermidine synthase
MRLQHAASEVQAKSARPVGVPRFLFLLFFLSGISGLMYEVVWVRMLTRILGSTVYATSTVLAAFMAGLAIGSYVLGRYADRARRPLLWYAVLELGIGVSALVSLALPDSMLAVYQGLYEHTAGSRAALIAAQTAVCLVLLLVPTALMGGTLPTLCVAGARFPGSFARCAGSLYALNTLGAVVGVLASGFVFIGEIGETQTILIGIVINLGVAAAAFVLRKTAPSPAVEQAPDAAPDASSPAGLAYSPGVLRAVLVCFAISGGVALAQEVVWGRMLLLYQGTSIYAFSAMLAVILLGMGVGSYVVGNLVGGWKDPLLALARIQMAIGVVTLLSLLLYPGQLLDTREVFLAPLFLVGPLGLLWGATFPVAVACFRRTPESTGRSIGALYAWNTLGCIAGSLLSGFVLVPLLGAGRSASSLAACSVLLGLGLLAVHGKGLSLRARRFEWAVAVASALLIWAAGDAYYQLTLRRLEGIYPGTVEFYRHVEDATAATTAFGRVGGGREYKQLFVNGWGMTRLETSTKLMAHLPIWLADSPQDVLIICFGMGTTVRSASLHEEIQVQAVELVPGVLQCYGFFHADAAQVLQRPNLRVAVDDGRNHLLVRPQLYDVITIDPAPPLHSAGTVNLYSREFMALCRQRLRPGGITCLWVPQSNQSEVKMIMRTFLDVFPHVGVWGGPAPDYGFYLLGSENAVTDSAKRIRTGFQNSRIAADLKEWNNECDSPEKVLALFLAEGPELMTFVRDSPIISDDRPYTEFPLWRGWSSQSEYRFVLDRLALRRYLDLERGQRSRHGEAP